MTDKHVRTAYLVKQLELALRTRLDAMVRVHGLTTPQYVTLTSLRSTPGLSSAELARRAFVSAQTMQEMVAALEHKGFLRREPDPANQRILRARLTEQGERVLADSDDEFDGIERDMTGDLSDKQMAALRRTLRACLENLT